MHHQLQFWSGVLQYLFYFICSEPTVWCCMIEIFAFRSAWTHWILLVCFTAIYPATTLTPIGQSLPPPPQVIQQQQREGESQMLVLSVNNLSTCMHLAKVKHNVFNLVKSKKPCMVPLFPILTPVLNLIPTPTLTLILISTLTLILISVLNSILTPKRAVMAQRVHTYCTYSSRHII